MKAFVPVMVPRKSQPSGGSSASAVAVDDAYPPLDMVENTPGRCYSEFVDCLFIALKDVELIKDDPSITDEDITTMEVIQGKYWKVGEVDSFPVFRQEATEADSVPFNPQLFLAHMADGWFLTSSLSAVSDDTKVAWLGSSLSCELDPVHLPFWAKKRSKFLTIKAAHMMQKQPQAVGGGGGGWLNKCKKLIGFVKEKDWARAEAFADELSTHPTMLQVTKGSDEKKRRMQW